MIVINGNILFNGVANNRAFVVIGRGNIKEGA